MRKLIYNVAASLDNSISYNEIDFVRALRTQAGKPIWLCGGGELAGTLWRPS